MSFKKYSSLENHTNSKFLTKIFDYLDRHGLRDTTFIAREKIHGTNFSVIINKDSITPAKRTGPITETEKFFGYEDLMAKYKSNFEEIQKSSLIARRDCTYQIFGEYAGGNIQKEVDYGEKDFYVFDILVTDEDGKSFYMHDDNAATMANVYKLKFAPLIARGTLEELLKLPVEFESVVNEFDKSFERNEVNCVTTTFKQNPPKDNVAEGLVIKPNRPIFIGESRLAIKYKTDAFKEKGKSKAPAIPVPLSDKDKELLNEFSKFVEPARVRNVASHIGEITPKMFGQVMGLTVADVLKESEREGLTIDVADAPSKLKNEIQKLVTSQVREIWQDLIN